MAPMKRARVVWRGIAARPALFFVVMLWCATAWAHVGSPDVYVRGDAGPYTVYVSVHPPVTVPGAAEIDVHSTDAAVTGVSVVSGDAGAVSLKGFSQEEKFVGSAWVPAGARVWNLRVQVMGSRGTGEMMVPVTLPAFAAATRRWVWPLIFGGEAIFFLVAGYLGLRWRRAVIRVRALELVVRPARFPRAILIMARTLMLCGVVALGACVWSMVRTNARRSLTPAMQIAMVDNGVMDVKLTRVAGGHALDDLAPDHGHMMHLFLIRMPNMDVVLHLHPALVNAGKDAAEFTETMPPMADGAFAIYADVVHGDGVAETATAVAGLPLSVGHPLTGDDSVGVVTRSVGDGCGSTAVLADGYRMTLACDGDLKAKTGMLLRVSLVDAAGNIPTDMTNYMGMGGHAAIVARDGSVFAHIHPMGTVMVPGAMSLMAGMDMPVSNVVEFPYGFPAVGEYRVFVQMKHGAVVETGAFDLSVQ